jgi:hypothetical protein
MGEMSDTCRVLVGKPKGRRTFGRHIRRREGNIKIYLSEMEWENVDRIHVAQDRGN